MQTFLVLEALANLRAVQRILQCPHHWCKGANSFEGHWSICGALELVKNKSPNLVSIQLEYDAEVLVDRFHSIESVALLQTIRCCYGEQYTSIKDFNDHAAVTHDKLMRVLSYAIVLVVDKLPLLVELQAAA